MEVKVTNKYYITIGKEIHFRDLIYKEENECMYGLIKIYNQISMDVMMMVEKRDRMSLDYKYSSYIRIITNRLIVDLEKVFMEDKVKATVKERQGRVRIINEESEERCIIHSLEDYDSEVMKRKTK